MRGVQDFLKESATAMVDYIAVVSTVDDTTPSLQGDGLNGHDRLNVVNALRNRTRKMKVLDKEAVPLLPHLLDIPKHLAIITSAVIRGSRELNSQNRQGDDADLAVDEFYSKCAAVEEEALVRVSQLATKLALENRRPPHQQQSTTHGSGRPDGYDVDSSIPHSHISRVTSTVVSTNNNRPTRPRRSSRPATAPSPTASTSPNRHQTFFGDSLVNTNPRLVHQAARESQNQNARPLHMKAPSTDSVPAFGTRDPPISIRFPQPSEPPIENNDDAGKRKPKGLFLRGILKR